MREDIAANALENKTFLGEGGSEGDTVGVVNIAGTEGFDGDKTSGDIKLLGN